METEKISHICVDRANALKTTGHKNMICAWVKTISRGADAENITGPSYFYSCGPGRPPLILKASL